MWNRYIKELLLKTDVGLEQLSKEINRDGKPHKKLDKQVAKTQKDLDDLTDQIKHSQEE